eukprot:GGOE01040778.1.p1 GENE.GGOE01040778.1~~GGOE01040778.1.p1  ORF type:complete len:377 (+),score=146.45 GGOE01040778.1:67-1131(+)
MADTPSPRDVGPPSPERWVALKHSLQTAKADRARALHDLEVLKAQLAEKEQFCQQMVTMGLNRLKEEPGDSVGKASRPKVALAREVRQVKAMVAGQLHELRQQGGEVLRALRGLEDANLGTGEGEGKVVQHVKLRPVIVEKVVEKLVTVEKVIQQPVEVERVVERIVPVPRLVQQLVEVDRVVERAVPVEHIVERLVPTDRVVEVPVERVVEKVVTVPVERRVEVPVIQERLVREVVEVPVERPIAVPGQRAVEAEVPTPAGERAAVDRAPFAPAVDEEGQRRGELVKRRVEEMLANVQLEARPPEARPERETESDIHKRIEEMLSSLKAQKQLASNCFSRRTSGLAGGDLSDP